MMFAQNKIWKWGSHWGGKNNPSHYGFMNDEGIIIGIDRFRYSDGDLVVITNGFLVKAIAMIEEEPKAITTNPAYSFVKNKYNIDYEDWVNYAKAEWFELPKEKVFEYKVQRGAGTVHKADVKETIIKLWNNRNK
jgi:hypothetical protein